jgi:2-methylcitrate dehydratase PrpD
MQKTISEKLSEFGLGLSYEDLPSAVVEKIKDLVLDTLGISAASATMGFGLDILHLVGAWGGAAEAKLIGSKAKVPAHNATLAHGVLAHGLDYDDTHTDSVVHPSACLVPVALAVGEKHGRSGRDLVADLAAGLEIMIRLGMPARNRFHMRGFHTTSICGTFAAAVIAGRVMGFDAGKMVDALGICGSFTSGLLECISAGSGAKRLHTGWAGLGGIVAAQLAHASVSGPSTVFEGRLGVYASFLRGEEIDLTPIFADIGRKWEILNIRPKLYPACHYLQSFLDAVRVLKDKHALDQQSIEGINCRVSAGAANIVCTPWFAKLDPQSGYDARFSLPYAVALMLVRGKAGLDQFAVENLNDPEIRAAMSKVHFDVDPSYQVKDMPAFVEVLMKDGSSVSHHIPKVRGDAESPIDRQEIMAKFRANSILMLKPEKSETLAAKVLNLEAQKDVAGIMEYL